MTTWVGPDECTDTVPEGCDGSGANNINIFGYVVGGFRDNSGNFVHHGLVRTPEGKLITFDVPGAGAGSYQGTGCSGCALGFNLWGAIAGIWVDPNYVYGGFLRSPEGKFTTFTAPNSGAFIGNTSLNDLGAVTGTYIDANNVLHGYLRTPEGKFVTVDPSGSFGTNSLSINDSDAITGYYVDANNVWHGFLMVPK
jgi:hypothetical protein